MVIKDLST